MVLSPLSRQVLHEYSPLNPFMLHTRALAGRSTVHISSIPRQQYMPSGVETTTPIHVHNSIVNHVYLGL